MSDLSPEDVYRARKAVRQREQQVEREAAKRATEQVLREKAAAGFEKFQKAAADARDRLQKADWPNGDDCVGLKKIIVGYKQHRSWRWKRYYTQVRTEYLCWDVGSVDSRGRRNHEMLLASNGRLYVPHSVNLARRRDKKGNLLSGAHELTAETIFEWSQHGDYERDQEVMLQHLQQLGH